MADEIIGFDDRGFRRAVKAIREVENHVLQGPPQAPPQVAPLILHAVPFLNNAAEEMPAYGVARITGSTTVNSETMLTADKPGTTFGDSYLVNGEQPVAAGKVGSGYTYDPPFILYDTGTPAAAEGWGPKPGQWSLSKGFPATTSVRELSDSTNKFIEGTLHCITTALIRFTGSVSNNTSTTSYKIYAGTMGSESDAGFTTVPSARNRTGARVNNDWALLVRVNNGWEIVNLEGGGSSAAVPRICYAELSADLASGDSTASVTGIYALDGDSAPTPDYIFNTLQYAGLSGDACFIIEDLSGLPDSIYHVLAIKLKTLNVLTSVSISGTDLVYTSRTISVSMGTDDSGDTTIDSLDDCA